MYHMSAHVGSCTTLTRQPCIFQSPGVTAAHLGEAVQVVPERVVRGKDVALLPRPRRGDVHLRCTVQHYSQHQAGGTAWSPRWSQGVNRCAADAHKGRKSS